MKPLESTERTRIRREPTRSVKDRAALYRIIDEALIGHVGFLDKEQPFVIPTFVWRIEDSIYMHGSRGSRMLVVLASGAPACVTFTLLDSLVMARSPFYHSANYRSAVVLGKVQVIEESAAKLAVLEQFMDRIAPGRWSNLRESTQQEIDATTVLTLPLDEASVKVRAGDPGDGGSDLEVPVWSGQIPVRQSFGPMIPAQNLLAGLDQPDYSAAYESRWREQ